MIKERGNRLGNRQTQGKKRCQERKMKGLSEEWERPSYQQCEFRMAALYFLPTCTRTKKEECVKKTAIDLGCSAVLLVLLVSLDSQTRTIVRHCMINYFVQMQMKKISHLIIC